MRASHFTRILLIALLAVSLACGCSLQPTFVPKQPRYPVTADGKPLNDSAKYWLNKVEQFRAENKNLKPGGIVLLGDSITARFPVKESFPDLHVINRGIGGDRIGGPDNHGLIDRLDLSVYDLKPKQLFVLIGINDIIWGKGGLKPIKRNYRNLLAILKKNCPGCQIYIQSVLPVRGKFTSHNPAIVSINEYLKRLAPKYGFTYLDLHSHFTDEKGELKPTFTKDGLHLTPAGYQQWQQILLPLMQD